MPFPLLPITIEEQTGKRRRLVLIGSILPREGQEMNLSARQRTKVNRYTGNSAATVQVLGEEFLPIRIGGLLEDRRMGRRGAATEAMYQAEQMAGAGRECSLTYSSHFRRVLWREWNFKVIEPQRIQYRIEFEVIDNAKERPQRVRPSTREVPSTTNAITITDEALVDLGTVPIDAGPNVLPQATESMQNARSFIVDAGVALNFVATPGSLLNAGAAVSAASILQNARSEVGAATNLARQLDFNLGPITRFQAVMDSGRSVLRARSSIRSVSQSVGALSASVERLAGSGGSSSGQVYIAAAGDTLQRISERFYGTPNRWTEIYNRNGLPSPTLVGGEQLILIDVPEPDAVYVP